MNAKPLISQPLPMSIAARLEILGSAVEPSDAEERENKIIPQSLKIFSERNLKLAIYQLIKLVYMKGSKKMWSDNI